MEYYRRLSSMVVASTILLFMSLSLANAQTGTAQTKAALNTEQGTNFADNTSNAITPLILRQTVVDMIASWQQAPKVNAQTGTSYTVVVDDYGKLITLSNAAAVAVTVPQATTTFATFNAFFCNQGAGTVTLTPTTSTVNGSATHTLLKNQCSWLVSDGTNYQAATLPPGNLTGNIKGPTFQTFTTGTNATYTTPSAVTWIEITIVGGGSGGSGGGATLPAGTAGNPSCWNTSGTACTSPVYQGGGGAATAGNTSGGAGGTVSGSGTCIRSSGGGGGGNGNEMFSVAGAGAAGGSSTLGGGGVGVQGAVGSVGAANTGGGGGGGGQNGAATLFNAPGGGAGATCYVIINNPAATYTYTVGATAAGGTAGGNGFAGGAGSAGLISVVEHYGQ